MAFDFQNLLKDWGVTLSALTLAGLSFLILLTFGIREFSAWFFKINKVAKTQDSVLAELQTIQRLLEIQNTAFRKLELVKPSPFPEKPESPGKFPLGETPPKSKNFSLNPPP